MMSLKQAKRASARAQRRYQKAFDAWYAEPCSRALKRELDRLWALSDKAIDRFADLVSGRSVPQ